MHVVVDVVQQHKDMRYGILFDIVQKLVFP